jgi:hypothetical protein
MEEEVDVALAALPITREWACCIAACLASKLTFLTANNNPKQGDNETRALCPSSALFCCGALDGPLCRPGSTSTRIPFPHTPIYRNVHRFAYFEESRLLLSLSAKEKYVFYFETTKKGQTPHIISAINNTQPKARSFDRIE